MAIQQRIVGQARDLGGGFVVQRLLPSALRQAVGPFLFMDHFGPVTVQPDAGHDVRPHPHIGLATVTYLLDGAIMHRDNLGSEQEITPGAINWMTAGSGIVHSERRPQRLQGQSYVNHGFQLWAGLPDDFEEVAPEFVHTPASDIPVVDQQGTQVRVLVGDAYGVRSPVRTFSPTILLDLQLPAGAQLQLPALAPELALYPVDADLTIDGEEIQRHTLNVLAAPQQVQLHATQATRVLVVGGAPLAHRYISWNFVSSRKERVAQAAADWHARRMAPVPGDDERIELPPALVPR
ncbi:MAG: pirin family protein [Rhodoferax sp.]|nr:pirin family protein [Rhodoferax sp.]MBP9931309.1 pirin family protein [Rhodoferax sp.]HQZ08519.1 pirin family protein [Burkholderiaceae bacterium]HRA64011.1 pirin family protein [Burkholderiaceae bacterium]